jgi:hypothetical protein
MGWFGPTKRAVWRQLSREIGAEFVDGGFWKGVKVQAHPGPWTVTLDTFTESSGESSVTYTRVRAPYVNPDGFRFTIHRKGFFSGLGRLLGVQDIEVGDPEFDEAFVVKGNDETKVRDLLSAPEVRRLIRAQPQVRLEVKGSEGWFGSGSPEGVDLLQFEAVGVIKDIDRLKALFELFGTVLDRLSRIRSAVKPKPELDL